tara:strand:- start:7610 stop:7819 length:210 start_codon:yes stop_codon:yes gene_type:complete
VRAKNSGTLVKGQKNNFKIFDFGYLIFFQMDFRIGPLPFPASSSHIPLDFLWQGILTFFFGRNNKGLTF